MESERKRVSLAKLGVKCYATVCSRTAIVSGLCHAHYYQKITKGEFKEIRRRIVAHKDEFGRVCTECFEYKKYKYFYRTSNGNNYRAKCSECTIKLNTITNRKRTQ